MFPPVAQSEMSSAPIPSSVLSHQFLVKNIPEINLLSKDIDKYHWGIPNFYSNSRIRSCNYQMARDRPLFVELEYSIDQESQVLIFQFES